MSKSKWKKKVKEKNKKVNRRKNKAGSDKYDKIESIVEDNW